MILYFYHFSAREIYSSLVNVRLLRMRSIFLLLIPSVYSLCYSKINAVVDAAVHSEHGKVIQCDFKPGSIERSIDLDKRVNTSTARQMLTLPSANEN
jgi:hypothetical protein